MPPVHPRPPGPGSPQRILQYPGKDFKCKCGKGHAIQLKVTHKLHERLKKIQKESKDQFPSVTHMIHYALEVYSRAADSGREPEGYLDPPRRRIEVQWEDLRMANLEDVRGFCVEHSIQTHARRYTMVERIFESDLVLVVGRVGGERGIPRDLAAKQK